MCAREKNKALKREVGGGEQEAGADREGDAEKLRNQRVCFQHRW